MNQDITIPYHFDPPKRPWQLKVLQESSRFKILVMPRKSGKTALAINKLLIEAFKKPGKTFWFVAPTYRQAKEIVWKDPEMLKTFLPEELIEKKNELDLSIYLKNGSVLSVKGADEPDALRGPNPAMVVLDEFALMKPEVWTEII